MSHRITETTHMNNRPRTKHCLQDKFSFSEQHATLSQIMVISLQISHQSLGDRFHDAMLHTLGSSSLQSLYASIRFYTQSITDRRKRPAPARTAFA